VSTGAGEFFVPPQAVIANSSPVAPSHPNAQRLNRVAVLTPLHPSSLRL
jgi:hypothetical protein